MGWPCFGRWGGYTGVAGGQLFRAFDETSEGPACGAVPRLGVGLTGIQRGVKARTPKPQN